MSHDSDDVFDGIFTAVAWGPSPSTLPGCVLYMIGLALILVLAYACTSEADGACQEVAGERYDRIDGVCYRVEDNGSLVPAHLPRELEIVEQPSAVILPSTEE